MESAKPLPGGTVTFLFTDIEGSTRLWEEHPQAMEAALARHDALAAAIVPRHAGTLIKQRGEGDSLFAVFARTSDALTAATTLQRALCAEPWPAETPLRVRMALHTGDAALREGDYYGAAVNRCARLRAVGHGGQVLLSQTTCDRVRDQLPPEASLRDLGSHRLKDLQQPEHLYQLLHPSLPADFPPMRSLEAFAHNLPRQLTSFVGREKEMAEVRQLLSTTALLTLTGAGGCGKTRLALQIASEVLEKYAHGVWLVELAPLADPALVPQSVGSALGVREQPRRPLTETLADFLRPKSLLLVLDNCEHLLTACAELADALLRACPNLRILASSREALGIGGEQTYRVPSLALPPSQPSRPDTRHPTPDTLLQFEAVQLFADRARLSQASFAVTPANASAVVQVCQRLDGIPLAIELAAARVRSLPVEQICARLDDMFRLLTGGSRTALPRQQTLRALIDWSYDLLSEAERALLRRLSVFAGGWTMPAAEAVGADESVEAWGVLDLLTSLVDKSLALYDEQGGEGRYRLLETVRQYARDRLLEAREAEAVRERHRNWFLALAEEAEPKLRRVGWEEWLDRLEREHDNLRAALEWAREREGAELELRLAGALSMFWTRRNHWSEGRKWMEGSLALTGSGAAEADRVLTKARAHALRGAGILAERLGDYAAARSRFEESVRLCRELGDRDLLAWALAQLCLVAGEPSAGEESVALFRETGDKLGLVLPLQFLGNAALRRGDLAGARSFYEEGLALAQELGDRWYMARPIAGLAGLARREGDFVAAHSYCEETVALRRAVQDAFLAPFIVGLGRIVYEQGDDRRAAALFEESLALAQEQDARPDIADSLAGLGAVARRQGDYEAARTYCEQSLALSREFGGKSPWALTTLGLVAQARGEYAQARSCHAESLALRREQDAGWGLAQCMEGLAAVAAAEGNPERAARLFGAAEALRESVVDPLPPGDQADYDRNIASIRTTLDEEAFAAAWAEGRALELEEAIKLALEDCPL